MKVRHSKFTAACLSAILLIGSLATPVLAADTLGTKMAAGEGLSSEAVLTQEATRFSVTVPTILPVTVDAQNNVTVATDVSVKNNSIGPVVITGITKTEKGGWSLVETPSQKVGKKEIKFDISTRDSIIAGGQSTSVIYSALTSPQKNTIEAEAALDVVFTIGWNDVTHTGNASPKDKIAVTETVTLSVPEASGQLLTWTNYTPDIIKIETKTRAALPPQVVVAEEITITALTSGPAVIIATSQEGNTYRTEVEIVENSLQSIYVATPPTKTAYRAGDLFDVSSMTVKATYLSGTEAAITEYSYSKAPLTEGQASIEISYEEKGITKSVSLPIVVGKAIRHITTEPSVNGTFTVDKTEAVWGETITVTSTPDAAYRLKEISVNGSPIQGNTFTMPSSDVVVSVMFERVPVPVVGTKYEDATYEYIYGQAKNYSGNWAATGHQGWGVKLKNINQSGKIPSPLTEIQGYPVTHMNYLFQNSQATTLDLSSFDTSNVTDMTAMFFLSQATTLDLSSLNTSKVTSMSEMFYGSRAKTLDLSLFNTSNVTNMYKVFSNSGATTIHISSFDTSNVTEMGHMFSGSPANPLDLSSFDTSKVTGTEMMFLYSPAITGYARTTADAAKLNASSYKPASLTFRVK